MSTNDERRTSGRGLGTATLLVVAAVSLVVLALAIGTRPSPGEGPLELPASEPSQRATRLESEAAATSRTTPVVGAEAAHADARERADAPARAARPDARPATARSERDLFVELEALARADPPAFALRADSILGGAGPASEQMAALRAAYASAPVEAPSLFARAAATLAGDASAHGEPVASAAILWLEQRAARQPLARAALEEVVWSAAWKAPLERRAQALRALVGASPSADLPRLRARVVAEHDRDLYEAGLRSLDDRAGIAGDAPPGAVPD